MQCTTFTVALDEMSCSYTRERTMRAKFPGIAAGEIIVEIPDELSKTRMDNHSCRQERRY